GPHKGMKYVHVDGTNGKGSTVTFIANILMTAGYKTGVYISPFIHRFNERMCVNGEEISNEDIARIINMIREKVELMAERDEGCPTEFEVVTALGYQYFRDQGCDIVVLETGLGGRLDATNVIDTPEAAVITTIDFDHMEQLGNTLPLIAGEKAGIIKEGGRVVLYPQAPEADEVIARVCREKNAHLYRLDQSDVKLLSHSLDGQSFNYRDYKDLRLTMLSRCQCFNAATAVMTAELLRERGFNISEQNIRGGLVASRWPGRFEIMRRDPIFVVDSAHNAQGAAQLASNLLEYFPGKEITFVVGVSEDKDYHSVIKSMLPLAKRFIATQANSKRALPAEVLADHLRDVHSEVHVEAEPARAVEKALGMCGKDEVICSFGSLFHVGAVREFFEGV
ncbi:MAG: bifunctional folylpolyglutamate synthase/dihydrofolate synthase, partial [Defluviitaleaceae bacterium]|nr:bifunctional folylpolyglutamate synthase/dihydrofolate synthase [Defluviitaleaceae bacterium]